MARDVAGVLLAAGSSTRMGTNKLFVELGGETLLRRAARTALEAGLDPLYVVLGHESDRARAALKGLDCTIVINERHVRGMYTSVSAGFAALPQGTEAAVLLLADMPFVTADLVRALISRWQGEPLVISRYGEVISPPILYAKALFPELTALDQEGKELVQRHLHEAAVVAQPPSALHDLDFPADVERARSEID